jgi:predicted Rossmann fold nucleotide-binding protein DprA/Smf involved in DNA uptake
MRGALAAGGRAVGVLADGLERAAVERDHLEPIIDGKLTLVSPYDPAVGFNVGHAMQRNKVIYALADAGLVVNSDLGKGGTWAGAVEQLGKARLLPVYVRTGEGTSPGNAALLEHGARPWPEPRDGAALIDLLAAPSPERAEPLVQGELLLATPDSPSSSPARGQTPPAPAAGPAAGARKRHPRAGGRKGG